MPEAESSSQSFAKTFVQSLKACVFLPLFYETKQINSKLLWESALKILGLYDSANKRSYNYTRAPFIAVKSGLSHT